jgi:hypothetical protein
MRDSIWHPHLTYTKWNPRCYTLLFPVRKQRSYHLILCRVVVKDLHGWREGCVGLFIWLIFTPTFLALLEQKSSVSYCFILWKMPVVQDLLFKQIICKKLFFLQHTPIFSGAVSSSVIWIHLFISKDCEDQVGVSTLPQIKQKQNSVFTN